MQTYSSLGLLHHYRGELETSLGYYYKALILAQKSDNKFAISNISNNMGTVFRDMSDMDTAMSYFQKHLNVATRLGYKAGTAVAMGNIANTFIDRDQFKKAIRLLTKSLAIFERTGHRVGTIIALTNLGDSYFCLGNTKESRPYYEKALSLSTKIEYTMGQGISHMGLGRIHGNATDFKTATKHLTRASEIFENLGDKLLLSQIYAHLSLLFSSQGRQNRALQFAEKSLFYAESTGAKRERILALRAMGVAQPRKSADQAISYLERSISLAQIAKWKFEYAKGLYELSILHNRKKEYSKAIEKLNTALKIFGNVESQVWIHKAQHLLRTIKE